jgi:flagellar hook assembly protein FlgD
LPKAGHVTLLIFNSLGQEVRRLVDREQPAGYHFATWNGRDQQGKPVPTGVYHYRLQVGDFVSTKKMMMAK